MANQIVKASVIRDIQSFSIAANTGLPFSDINFRFTLTDNTTVKTLTIPATSDPSQNSYTAVIKYGVQGPEFPVVWVLPAATPTLTLPDGTPTASLSQLNPEVRTVVPGQVIQFLSNNDFADVDEVNVSVELYANPTPNYPN